MKQQKMYLDVTLLMKGSFFRNTQEQEKHTHTHNRLRLVFSFVAFPIISGFSCILFTKLNYSPLFQHFFATPMAKNYKKKLAKDFDLSTYGKEKLVFQFPAT